MWVEGFDQFDVFTGFSCRTFCSLMHRTCSRRFGRINWWADWCWRDCPPRCFRTGWSLAQRTTLLSSSLSPPPPWAPHASPHAPSSTPNYWPSSTSSWSPLTLQGWGYTPQSSRRSTPWSRVRWIHTRNSLIMRILCRRGRGCCWLGCGRRVRWWSCRWCNGIDGVGCCWWLFVVVSSCWMTGVRREPFTGSLIVALSSRHCPVSWLMMWRRLSRRYRTGSVPTRVLPPLLSLSRNPDRPSTQ